MQVVGALSRICAATVMLLRFGLEVGLGLLLQALDQRIVGIEQLCALFGQGAAVRTIAVEQLNAECGFGLLHDSPSLAIRHAHPLCGSVQRADIANAAAQVGNAATELGIAFNRGIDDC